VGDSLGVGQSTETGSGG